MKTNKKLLKILIKKEDGFIARKFNRKISIPISLFIVNHNIPISPNLMSFITFIVSCFASLCFVLRNNILGGILAQLQSILDGCDGEIARLKKTSSNIGRIIDNSFDRLSEFFIFLGIGYSQFLVSQSLYVLIFSFIFIFYFFLRIYIHDLLTLLNKKLYQKILKEKPKGFLDKIYLKLRRINLFTRDFLFFVIMIASFFNLQFFVLIPLFLIFFSYDTLFLLRFLKLSKFQIK